MEERYKCRLAAWLSGASISLALGVLLQFVYQQSFAVNHIQPGAERKLDILYTPDALTTWLRSARQHHARGQLSEARSRYEKVLHMQPRHREALLALAVIAQTQGRHREAGRYYQQLLLDNPMDSAALAGLLALKGGSRTQERDLKQALQQYPDSAHLYAALGNFYASQQRWGAARNAYLQAYQRQPQAGRAYNLAISLDHLGDPEAIYYYRQALLADPSGPQGIDEALVCQRLRQLAETCP